MEYKTIQFEVIRNGKPLWLEMDRLSRCNQNPDRNWAYTC